MTTKAELQTENETLRSAAGSVGILIGANKEAISEARAAMLDILGCGMDQKTIRCALKTLDRLCAVNGTAITGCSISMGANND